MPESEEPPSGRPLDRRSATGSMLSGIGTVATVILTVIIFFITQQQQREQELIQQWQQQQQLQYKAQELLQQQQLRDQEKRLRLAQQEQEDTLRNVSFAERVLVSTFMQGNDYKVIIGNANSAPADVWVFIKSVSGSKHPTRGLRILPCDRVAMLVPARHSWQVIVQRGGRFWTTGSNPGAIPLEQFVNAYGIKNRKGQATLTYEGFVSLPLEPARGCSI
ncbi:hypothetical protein ACQP1K_24990 [Sphaerimonospora sp. CA-214678]|uniref:hypothetical protein n=1 Tax=Sphaerimonospora sp. CA-214678 TaxID=3240029 RepID=UPI003D8DA44B